MTSTYSRDEIRANRQKWIDFLKQPSAMKMTGILDLGQERRCCLGHGCYALQIERQIDEKGVITYDEQVSVAPQSFVNAVGLHDSVGRRAKPHAYKVGRLAMTFEDYSFDSLVDFNDKTDATPQEIGAYLQSVIEGGLQTPFKPLEEYPE